jgi:hypothetical protein
MYISVHWHVVLVCTRAAACARALAIRKPIRATPPRRIRVTAPTARARRQPPMRAHARRRRASNLNGAAHGLSSESDRDGARSPSPCPGRGGTRAGSHNLLLLVKPPPGPGRVPPRQSEPLSHCNCHGPAAVPLTQCRRPPHSTTLRVPRRPGRAGPGARAACPRPVTVTTHCRAGPGSLRVRLEALWSGLCASRSSLKHQQRRAWRERGDSDNTKRNERAVRQRHRVTADHVKFKFFKAYTASGTELLLLD